MLNLGIVQGRLTEAPPGELQWFPHNNWKNEFGLAKNLGFQYIELIAEEEHNEQNPLWHEAGIQRLNQLIEHNSLMAPVICDDYIIQHAIQDPSVLKRIEKLIINIHQLNVKKLVLPLFGKSKIKADNLNDFFPVIKHLAAIANHYSITICLETLLDGSTMKKFLHQFTPKTVCCVYDTGNQVAIGHDLYHDILILNKSIGHVHIKDKNQAGENVLLGTGRVNFSEIFKALKEINYEGDYTFETCRGRDPLATARYHKQLVEFFYYDNQA